MGDDKNMSDEVRTELKEKYLQVRKLLEEDSRKDPENEPYKSKYAGLEILKKMQDLLLNSVDNMKQQEHEVRSMLAIVYLNEGIICVDTDELKPGQDYLMNCIDVLSKTEIRPDTVLPMISALNQLGILWSKRDQAAKAKEYLEQAKKVYDNYKSSNSSPPESMSVLFGVDDTNEIPTSVILEKLNTLTLYYLAQIYGTLGDSLKSAIYCHMTLHKQLETNDYDKIDWALNAATLSQFFMEKGGFKQARHHLSSATYILEKLETELKEISSDGEKDDNDMEIMDSLWENLKHRRGDVYRCWAKYGILLMSMSRERLIARNENAEDKSTSDSTNIQTDPTSDVSQECLDNLTFKELEPFIQDIANKVTDKYLLDFNDAKKVFLFTQTCLDNAKQYYTLENHASDHVQIVQDMSQLYKYLAFFEEDETRQAKMHKRRIDLLEGIVKELNEKYYKSVCQQIWIELGETYSVMLDIKLDRLKAIDDRPTAHMLIKINNLTKSAIDSYTKFLDSVKETDKEKIPEELVNPALCAYFNLGRLYNKFITPDKRLQLEYTKKSLDSYTYLVNYCEKDQKAAELMTVELSICKDFVKLLPAKVSKLTRELSSF